MSEIKNEDGSQEMENHLSSIQNSVDSTIQGLGSRNELVRTSSSKFLEVTKDLNGRLETLQEYSSALRLKKKEIKDQINLFYQHNKDEINIINSQELAINNQIKSLEDMLAQISNQITKNQEMKDSITNQILKKDQEDQDLDTKNLKYQEILNRPVQLNRNDDIINCIQEAQKSLSQINEKIQSKMNNIQKFQSCIQILNPIHKISQSLKNANEKYTESQEEEYLIQKKIEIERSISQEKQEKLSNILSQIKENKDGIDIFRKNLVQIKTANSEISHEKEKIIKISNIITPLESELHLLQQEYDKEVKKEIIIAHEFNEIDEKIQNKDPDLVLIERKINELQKELKMLLQRKDDLLIIENSLQNEIDNFAQKTMLIKEKISKEITEGTVFYEQKLYKELRNDLNANDSMHKDIEDLIMMINVLEAEKKRLYKKIILSQQKIEKYKEKVIQLKKLRSKIKRKKSKLNDLQISIEALQYKIDQLLCINEHKKEDIQTKKLSIEQTLLKFYHPSCQGKISKTNVLNPIVPILNNRGEAAKIIYKTASYTKKMFSLQKNLWNDINLNDIDDTFERWEDTLEKTQPSIEKNLLLAFVELVC